MNENLESQRDEEEALLAIYDGDPAFKHISPTMLQYLCGEKGKPNSILLEFSWPPDYPTAKLVLNLDTFYNQNLGAHVKNFILEKINEKSEQFIGMATTYTLIEYVKDELENWFSEADKLAPSSETETLPFIQESVTDMQITESDSKKEPKKEHLSKAQKRRQWNRCDGHGEKPRGWDWVDIIKHLSQTGGGQLANISAS